MRTDGRKETKCGTESAHRSLDRQIAELAVAQHGVVALRQLRAMEIRPSSVRSRVQRGRLHRVHRGVYAVGHPLLDI
jgi:predicted transcriptional regulator of viral defense system